MWLVVPFIVFLTGAARKPADKKNCSPLPKSLGTHIANDELYGVQERRVVMCVCRTITALFWT